MGNYQAAVTALYVVPGKKRNADAIIWPLGLELDLPEDWSQDPARREAVGVPGEVVFRTKPQIALEILARVRAQRVPHRAILVEAGYGDGGPFRQELRHLREPSAAAYGPTNHRVVRVEESSWLAEGRLPMGIHDPTPAEPARSRPPEAWREIAWSQGTKGPLSAAFARRRVRVTDQGMGHDRARVTTDEEGRLVLERTPEELKAHLLWGLDDLGLAEQVFVMHNRWAIEQFHREIKQTLKMDSFEGRTWRGRHHHMAMIGLAYAFLARLRAERADGGKLPPFNSIHWSVVYAPVRFEVLTDQGLTNAQSKEIALWMMVGVLGLREPPE